MDPADKLKRKLDNAAIAFPAAAGPRDSRVFRVYCKLNQQVQPCVLQKALDQAILKYPLFQCRLKRGMFWFYFEETDARPVVKTETEASCNELYHRGWDNLLFKVTYNQDKINLEMFHALTDGTGACSFLSEIVKTYLRLLYGISEEDAEVPDTREEQEEDSFSRFYFGGRQEKQIRKSSRAYQLKGRKLPQEDMKIMECMISVRQLLAHSRAHRVSVTAYMTAVLLLAFSRGMTEKQKKKPVVLMIPVNLRNYYPSKSMANFFGWMEIEYQFHKKADFEDILLHVKKRFSDELRRDQVALRMNRYVKMEKNPLLRFIPLEIKNHFIKIGTRLGSRNVSAVLSNLTVMKMPQYCEPYIDRFGAWSSTDKFQMCACSYRDKFCFGVTSKLEDTSVQTHILEFFRAEGMDITVI